MELALRNVAELGSLGIDGGRIVAVGAVGPAERDIDVGGRVVVPGLVEPHIHLDKALLSARVTNRSGTLQEALQRTREAKASFTRDDVHQRAQAALEMCLRYGVTAMRAQTEFDPEIGLVGLEVLFELKSAYAQQVDIQVVAFPQEGLLKERTTIELFHEAMRMGADVVGGVPYVDDSAEAHIDLCLAMARQYDRPLSLHQDFFDDPARMSTEYLARRVIAEGMQGRVEIGHATVLGALAPDRLGAVAELLREADIAVVTLPLTDLYLGGRADTHNIRRGLAPVKALLDRGVTVAAGANNIRNPFTPFGTGDPLVTAFVLMPTAHVDAAVALELVTTIAAKAIGLPDYGLDVGCRADLVVLDTQRLSDAVIDLPARTMTLKAGKPREGRLQPS